MPIPSLSYFSRQQWGQALNTAALTISKPLHYSSEVFMRAILTPIRPGKDGNCNSAFLERIRRAFTVAISALFVPITLPLALIGGGLNFIAKYLKPHDYYYIKGKAYEKTDGKNLKFLTLNSCMIWGGLPIKYGGLTPPRHRIDKVANMILKKDPDFVVMQETAFGPGCKFYNKLKNNYAHFFTGIGANPWRMDSALFVASKYKVEDAGFIPYPKQCGMKRGVAWIKTPHFYAFTSHMEFGSDKKAKDERKAQIKIITDKMAELKKKSDRPCFLLGDLNLGNGVARQGYKNSGLDEHFINPYPAKYPGELDEKTATCTNKLLSHTLGIKPPKFPYEMDDYALLDKAYAKQFKLDVEHCSSNWKEPYKALSDHRALVLAATRV